MSLNLQEPLLTMPVVGVWQWFSLRDAEGAILEHCGRIMERRESVTSSLDLSEEERENRMAVGREVASRGGSPELDLDIWQVCAWFVS
jgi:hypothetical protein